jgi:hypothetical protein
LLPVPVGAPALPCDSTAEALNATKLISCIQMESVQLTLVAGSSSGVILGNGEKFIRKRNSTYNHVYPANKIIL